MDVGQFARDRLRQAREGANLSQREMAKLLGVAQATIADIERGRVQMTVSQVAQFAQILSKPITYFFPAELDKPNHLEAELLNVFRTLPSDWQKRAIYDVTKEVKLRERVLPYERAGIPEEFYGWLLGEEEQMMNLEEGVEYEPTAEELERNRREHEAFLTYRKTIDARLRAERSE